MPSAKTQLRGHCECKAHVMFARMHIVGSGLHFLPILLEGLYALLRSIDVRQKPCHCHMYNTLHRVVNSQE